MTTFSDETNHPDQTKLNTFHKKVLKSFEHSDSISSNEVEPGKLHEIYKECKFTFVNNLIKHMMEYLTNLLGYVGHSAIWV